MHEQAQLSSPAASPHVERRRGYRQSIQATGLLRTISPAPEQRSIPVHVFEISISGVAFSCSASLAIGSVWRFDLPEKRQVARRIEIRSSRARHDGMFDFGAMFC